MLDKRAGEDGGLGWLMRNQMNKPCAESAQAITVMAAQQSEWGRRYQACWQQKNVILSSAGSRAPKQERTEALLRQHYPEQEIAIARAYDAGSMRQ